MIRFKIETKYVISVLLDKEGGEAMLAALRSLSGSHEVDLSAEYCDRGKIRSRLLKVAKVDDSDRLAIAGVEITLLLEQDSIDYGVHLLSQALVSGYLSPPEFVQINFRKSDDWILHLIYPGNEAGD